MIKKQDEKNTKKKAAGVIALLMLLACLGMAPHVSNADAAQGSDKVNGGTVAIVDDNAPLSDGKQDETPAAPTQEPVKADETKKPQTPSVKPQTPVVEPETPSVEPETPSVEPETPSVEPETPSVEPETPPTEPETPSVEPETPPTEPETPPTEPEAPAAKTDLTKEQVDAVLNWLVSYNETEGSVAYNYFADRKAKSSLDSTGKNFAPDVNAALMASVPGISENSGLAWRIYKTDKGFNYFVTGTDITGLEVGSSIKLVRKDNESGKTESGSGTVMSKEVEGTTFNIINGGSFTPDAE